MLHWMKELFQRNYMLSFTGLIHIVVFLLCFIFIFFDTRIVLGVNVWIKPMKFALSIAIYTFTLVYLMRYVTKQKVKSFVTYITMIGMFTETTLIVFQAARGKKSHFNFDSTMDAMIYYIMGGFISLAFVGFVILAVHLTANKLAMPQYMAHAWRLGIYVSMVGWFLGFYLSIGIQHSVGGPDGGEGLAVLGWSINYGDLRAPHFFGLHALQIIPLLSYFLAKPLESMNNKIRVTWLIAVLYTIVLILSIIQAMKGNPLY